MRRASPEAPVQCAAARIAGVPHKLKLTLVVILVHMGFSARADSLRLDVGDTQVVRTAGKASTILLGDPNVADVTTVNETTLVITGKRPGRTSLIVFDAAALEVLRSDILISGSMPAARIRLYKGATGVVQEFRCSAAECAGPTTIRSSATGASPPLNDAAVVPEPNRISTPQPIDDSMEPAQP